MPLIGIAPENSVSREQLRTFHLTGRGLDAFVPKGPLHPALLEQLDLPRFEQNYPLYFAESQSPQPFFQLLRTVVDAHPSSFPILRDHLELIAGAFEDQIDPRGCVPVSSILDDALAAVQGGLESLPSEECAALRKALPREGFLIGFGGFAPLLLNCALLQSARREARLSFVRELEESCQRLRELLGIDDRKTEASPEHLAASLGARAASFLNPSALAEALRRRPNPTLPMEPERRARCESALATIQDAIADLKLLPSVILIHSGRAPEVPLPIAIQYEAAADACDSALSLCRRQLTRYVAVWKALRIARLEVESAFDPSIHIDALDAFDLSMAHPDEIVALPVVVVFETAQRIDQYLASFARLLQSSLPAQVLISCPGAGGRSLSCLPLAYQEAFALNSSIASTAHLIGSLSEMARTLRPAAAIVAVSESWMEASLLLLARAVPLWRYDPDRGESWYQRFALEVERPIANEQLTFVHAAALIPAFRNHFRILPGGMDSVSQAELVEYPADRPAQAFPFLLVTCENRQRSRAVFTRELANFCSAAQKTWRFLAELAVPKIVKEADPNTADRARLDGAKQAIFRVISLLKTDGDSA